MATRTPIVSVAGQYQQLQAGDLIAPSSGGVPTGTLHPFAGFTTPSGYLACDGSAVSRSTYADLFAALSISTTATRNGTTTLTAIPSTAGMAAGMPVSGAGIAAGTTIATVASSTSITLSAAATSSGTGGALVVAPFGVGDGSTTFNLPDLARRSWLGEDNMGTAAGAASRVTSASTNGANASRLGGTGGAETHTLDATQMPGHTHAASSGNFYVSSAGTAFASVSGVIGAAASATASAGGGLSHNNMPPWIAGGWIVKT